MPWSSMVNMQTNSTWRNCWIRVYCQEPTVTPQIEQGTQYATIAMPPSQPLQHSANTVQDGLQPASKRGISRRIVLASFAGLVVAGGGLTSAITTQMQSMT